MKVSINMTRLGKGQLWNRCTERYDVLGLICQAAGIENHEMDFRKSIVFTKIPDVKDKLGRVVKEFPVKDLPPELTSFFTEDTNWKPISLSNLGSSKFRVNALGQEIVNLNDQQPEDWQDKVMETLAKGGVEMIWEEEVAAD